MKNIAKAIVNVMREVKSIEKNATIGSGSNTYKGIADEDVKIKIGEAMQRNGLCILPIEIHTNTTFNGNNNKYFTEVNTKYMLLHESGEHIELAGLGHGVDTQDKGAGKATTYALKYALLYAFMIPKGNIDDADSTHSDELPKLCNSKMEEYIQHSKNITPIKLSTLKKNYSITKKQEGILKNNGIK